MISSLIPFRLGPTPPLTVFILVATGLETAKAFTQKVMQPDSPALFYGLITSTILLWWLLAVWFFWFVARPFYRAVEKSPRRLLWTTCAGIAVWLFLTLYTLAWSIRLYTGVFPDYDTLRMLQTNNGVNFIFSFIADTVPGALLWFTIGAAVSLTVIPGAVKWMVRRQWTADEYYRATRTALYSGLISGGVAICCLGYIVSGHDFWNRRAQLQYLVSTLSPPVSMITSSIQAIFFTEPIPANMTMASRLAIGPEPEVPTEWLSSPRPNVLYIAVESLRADLLFKEIDGVEVMPNLNQLARQGYHFARGYAQSSHTDYNVPAYLSSLYPLRTPEHHYYETEDPWPKKTITEYLAEHGYAAGIITADNTSWGKMRNFMWSDNLDVFFDSENMPTTYSLTDNNRGYVASPSIVKKNGAMTAADKHVVDIAMVWMQRQFAAEEPFILHTMFQESHYPYQPRSEYPKPFQPSDNTTFRHTLFKCPPDKLHVQRNAYYNSVYAVDVELGRLVSFLKEHGQWNNTIVVLAGDHGEAFDEKGTMAHAGPNIQPVIRVPMVIRIPGHEARTISYPTQQIDMVPTLCGLLGLPPHPTFQGINVLAEDVPSLEERDVYVSTSVAMSWRGDNIIHAGRWNFWANYTDHREELYDLENDPTEKHNLITEKPEIAKALRLRLKQWRQNQLAYYKYPMFYTKYYPPRVVTRYDSNTPAD